MTIFASPANREDGAVCDQIRLTGITATGFHGVLDAERENGQEFTADVVLHLDLAAAATSDSLEETVNYAEVAEQIHGQLTGQSVALLETLAERIAATLMAYPAMVAVDVRVHKPDAPISVPCRDVEVAIRRDRSQMPVVTGVVSTSSTDASLLVEPSWPVEPVPAVELVETPALVVEPVVSTGLTTQDSPADPLDSTPIEPMTAVLALGSNLGDPRVTLQTAVADVAAIGGVTLTGVSPLARTIAVGGTEGQPDFLNAVVTIRTLLSPRALLQACQAIELRHGRTRDIEDGPRTLDIDLIAYGDLVAQASDLTIPHPRAGGRAFVLVPWAELDPTALLPGLGGGPVAVLAETASDRGGIRWLSLDWLPKDVASLIEPDSQAPQPSPAVAPVVAEAIVAAVEPVAFETTALPQGPATPHSFSAPPANPLAPQTPGVGSAPKVPWAPINLEQG